MKKIGNIYAQMATFCLVLFCIFDISNEVSRVQNDLEYTLSIGYIITWIAMIGMAASVIMNSRKGAAIAAGVWTLLYVYYTIRTIRYLSLQNVLCLIAYAALVAVTVLSLKEKPLVKKIWFIPGALILLKGITVWIEIRVKYEGRYIGYFLDVVLCVGLILVGMWLRSFGASTQAAPAKNKVSQILVLVAAAVVFLSVLIGNYAFYDCGGTVLNTTYYYFYSFFRDRAFYHVYGYMFLLGFVVLLAGFIMSVISDTAVSSLQKNAAMSQRRNVSSAQTSVAKIGSDADRLKVLKELLDAGALTQEEFEEKKKQILGL